MRGNTSTLHTTNIHLFKYNLSNAHRILKMMSNSETPTHTRRILRESLKRIAVCTDIDKRTYLRAESIAVLLRVAVQHQASEAYRRAHQAHRDLWTAFNERDRVEHPRRWIRFDEVMRAYQRRCKAESRPRARRAIRPFIAPAHTSSMVQQIAA